MKRIIIFIGLKIVEISTIIFIPYYLGMLLSKWTWYCDTLAFDGVCYYAIFFFSLCFLVLILVAGYVVLAIINANWKWAERIAKK